VALKTVYYEYAWINPVYKWNGISVDLAINTS